jgi:predicted nucleotidyltransferase
MSTPRLPIPADRITDFSRRWKIVEFALFGSVLRDDFGPESDVDVLVSFAEHAEWSLLDLAAMQIELEELFGRPVDLVEKRSLVNPFRRHSILTSKQVVYAA